MKKFYPICYETECYGLKIHRIAPYLSELCPCTTCIIKSMCVNECEARRKFAKSRGLAIRADMRTIGRR